LHNEKDQMSAELRKLRMASTDTARQEEGLKRAKQDLADARHQIGSLEVRVLTHSLARLF
jgi:hypothetical protein